MNEILSHYGIKGMKWGVRRYQNSDGTLTSAGKKRYSDEVYVSRPCEDGKKVGMIRIRDIKYIEPVELHCKHYIPDTGVNIR